MASKKKLLQAAAGSAGGAGLDIPEVFSTYLYDGTGSAQTITNGIDLSGEGGLVWAKCRNIGYENMLTDTARGTSGGYLQSDNTSAQATGGASPALTAFNSNGFTLGTRGEINNGSGEFVSWTFRKAPKFFDVVTYTGNGVSGRSISHNLNGTVGTILFKRTDSTSNWIVWHRSAGGAYGFLDATDAFTADSGISNPTTTAFTIESTINAGWNASGGTYVAYLFAHNNSDGDFGPNSDQDVIKCGSFTTDGSSDATIDLGFEPQWVLFKRTDSSTSGAWNIFDSMRGMQGDFISQGAVLEANKADAEQTGKNLIAVTPTGFKIDNYGANRDFIYMAIRRGPLAEPENATDVFDVNTYTSTGSAGNKQTTGFPVDLTLIGARAGASWNHGVVSRLTGGDNYLSTNSTAAEVASGAGSGINLDDMTGYDFDGAPFNNDTNMYNLNWKRAPGYFDVVAYTGTGSSSKTINHNLGVVPEMIWVKSRSEVKDWRVYHKNLDATAPEDKYLKLNTTDAVADSTGTWNDTAPTATQFTVGNSGDTNNAQPYIAYLFATVAGVSKVGSFSHTSGQTQNIDCGFSSGARFVLVKQYGGTGNWFVYDTARGIVAGNDPRLQLNTTAAENTANDDIDPLSSGFTLTTNFSGGDYIFYAIA